MYLVIEWNDKERWGEEKTLFPNVDPKTLSLDYNFLTFGAEGYKTHWNHHINDIKSFHFEED